jgi:hypothetical protein
MSTDWLPRTRAAQLEMAKRWYPLVNTQKTAWKIPATEVTRLRKVTDCYDSNCRERLVLWPDGTREPVAG